MSSSNQQHPDSSTQNPTSGPPQSAPTSQNTGLFGTAPAASQGTGLFGGHAPHPGPFNGPPPPPQQTPGGLFGVMGGGPLPPRPQHGGLFGVGPPAPQPPPGGLFGPPPGGLFGPARSAAQPTALSSGPHPPQHQHGLFRPLPDPNAKTEENRKVFSDEKLKFFTEFENLLNSSTFSDLTITSKGYVFHAHNCILSLRTPFFGAATGSGFAGSETKTVSLDEHSLSTVWRFLQWCYTGDYEVALPAGLEAVEPDHEDCDKHTNVYFLADYLGAEDLKKAAITKFQAWFGTLSTSMFQTGVYSSWFLDGSESARKSFMQSVRDIFANTVQEEDMFRNVVVCIAADNHEALKKQDGYKELLMEADGFAAVLALKFNRR